MKMLTALMSIFAFALVTFLTAPEAIASSGGFIGEPFVKVIYVKFGGSALRAGSSYDSAKSCAADADLWAIPAGTVISKVYAIVDTAITGTTTMDFGDDDDPNGFFDGGVNGMESAMAVGMWGWDAKVAGADLRIQTAGATDAADIYVVPSAKYYSAAGKEVKMDLTTACTAGRIRVIIEGYYAGTK